jgi:tRNA threonylcarbamoyladenosine biosynthesis protein TsaB
MDIPLISIPTLEALAHQAVIENGLIIPMLDARRLEVYAAVFSSENDQIRETKAEVLDKNSYYDYLKINNVCFIGDGVEKFKSLCKHKNAIFMEGKLPSAKQMGALAEIKYRKNDFEDVAYFEPYYLKDFIAG